MKIPTEIKHVLHRFWKKEDGTGNTNTAHTCKHTGGRRGILGNIRCGKGGHYQTPV